MDLFENFNEFFSNIVVFESSLDTLLSVKGLRVIQDVYCDCRCMESSVLCYFQVYTTVLYLTIFILRRRFPLNGTTCRFQTMEKDESSSSLAVKRFVSSANWYLQHILQTCKDILSSRKSSIRVLSDDYISGIPETSVTLV